MLLQNRILLHFIALRGMNSPQRRLSRLLYVTPSTDNRKLFIMKRIAQVIYLIKETS